MSIPARLGVIQRVLPSYRAPFFEALAGACPKGMSLFAGQPRPEEAIETRDRLDNARVERAANRHLLSGKFYLLWQSGLLEWLKRWQPEALVVEANPRYLSTPLATRWMRARRRPVIGWGLGAPRSGRLPSAARRQFLRQFDALITYSAQGRSEYIAAGFPPERVFVAPNAAAARPTREPPARAPRLTPAQVTLLFVGRLQKRKRIDLLLAACGRLPEGQRPHLWIVGDGPARAELEQAARRDYPSANFTGARHGAALEPFFKGADLFVLPGTGGLAVQQAMSYGLPVLVGEADGTQSDLVRPENGWQIPPGDLEALTAALLAAISDVPRLRQMGQASYRITRDEINLEHMVEIFTRAVAAVL